MGAKYREGESKNEYVIAAKTAGFSCEEWQVG